MKQAEEDATQPANRMSARRTNARAMPQGAMPQGAMPQALVRVHFHNLAAGGDAVGRDETGRAIFVPGAAPGDIALVEIEREHKVYARGRLAQLETTSAARVEPPCPFYARPVPTRPATQSDALVLSASGGAGDLHSAALHFADHARFACGGCQWQHVEYAAQLEAKRNLVSEALRRIGGAGDSVRDVVEPCVPSPAPFAYRNKAEFVVALTVDFPEADFPEAAAPFQDGEARATDEKAWRAGFFARESHQVVDVSHCLIQQEPNNGLLRAARGALEAGFATPFNPATGDGVLRRLTARTASAGDSLLIAETTDADWPQARAFAAHMRAAAPNLVGVLRRQMRHDQTRREQSHEPVQLLDGANGGRDWLEETVSGLRLRVTGDGFFQVNTALTPALLETALRLAEAGPGQRVLDAFCGVGLFSLALARAGADVTGIEVSRAAVRDARDNAARNALPAAFREGDAAREMNRLAHRAQNLKASSRRAPGKPAREPPPEIVLLDPPRAGAAACVPALLRLRPRRIVYVSCDPATLARDVRALSAGGYRLARAVPLDLFPQTAHVETVAQLDLVDGLR